MINETPWKALLSILPEATVVFDIDFLCAFARG
jgi:hypothetical protein